MKISDDGMLVTLDEKESKLGSDLAYLFRYIMGQTRANPSVRLSVIINLMADEMLDNDVDPEQSVHMSRALSKAIFDCFLEKKLHDDD